MGVRVAVGEGEPIGLALKRFRKQLDREGVLWEMRRRVHVVGGTQIRRAKRFRKKFKSRLAVLMSQMAGRMPVALLAEARAEFWRRTGEPGRVARCDVARTVR